MLDAKQECSKHKSILYNNLATCHYKRLELKESLYYTNRCLELDPEYVKAWYRKAQIKKDKGKNGKALEICIQSIQKYQHSDKEACKLFGEMVNELKTKLGDANHQEQKIEFLTKIATDFKA